MFPLQSKLLLLYKIEFQQNHPFNILRPDVIYGLSLLAKNLEISLEGGVLYFL